MQQINDQRDYFVSYTAADELWARWIVWELEKAGYSCRVQFRDFVPGSDFISEMRNAMTSCRQTLALFSPNYFDSEFATSEMQAAFAADPIGAQRSLVPVRVAKCQPGDLIRGRIYIDLVGLGRDEARVRLIEGIEASRIGIRPTGATPINSRPFYPGDTQKAKADSKVTSKIELPPLKQLRVLFLGAEAETGLNLSGELKNIKNAVAKTKYPHSIAFESNLDVTPDSLLPLIHKVNPHVCHFAGKQDGGNIVIRTKDRGVTVISDHALGGLFQALGKNMRMAIFDTCQSARCARNTTRIVPFSMGVYGDIYDESAIAFYTDFYRAIASGHSLANAVTQSQAVLSMKDFPEDEIPVLFTKTGFDAATTHLVNTD